MVPQRVQVPRVLYHPCSGLLLKQKAAQLMWPVHNTHYGFSIFLVEKRPQLPLGLFCKIQGVQSYPKHAIKHLTNSVWSIQSTGGHEDILSPVSRGRQVCSEQGPGLPATLQPIHTGRWSSLLKLGVDHTVFQTYCLVPLCSEGLRKSLADNSTLRNY